MSILLVFVFFFIIGLFYLAISYDYESNMLIVCGMLLLVVAFTGIILVGFHYEL